MNIRYASMLAGSILSAGLMAQEGQPNLVNNAGFEDLAKPVVTWDQLDHATGWMNANNGTADIHTKDAYINTIGIPDGEVGTGAAAFEGEHFAGFVAYKDELRPNLKRIWTAKEDHWRLSNQKYAEYLETALNGALTSGQKYDVTFRVKLANGSDRAVSGIGAYLSPTELKYHNSNYMQEKPQLGASVKDDTTTIDRQTI
jgi:hypothetical protein